MLARRTLAQEHDPSAQPTSGGGNPLALGLTAMATNFTTLPLMLSAGQHVGAAHLPWVESVPVLVLLVVIAVAPGWLPLLLARLAPRLLARRPHRAGRRPSVGAWLPVLACLLGAGLLLGRATHLLS